MAFAAELQSLTENLVEAVAPGLKVTVSMIYLVGEAELTINPA